MLHRDHGLLTCSHHSIDDAAFWFIALERACKQPILVESTGIEPQTVSEKTARYSREHVGSDDIGRLQVRDALRLHRRDPARHVRLSGRAPNAPIPAHGRDRC